MLVTTVLTEVNAHELDCQFIFFFLPKLRRAEAVQFKQNVSAKCMTSNLLITASLVFFRLKTFAARDSKTA